MWTSRGRSTYFQTEDRISSRLKGFEKWVYLELKERCVRKGQRPRLEKWEGSNYALERGEIRITIRSFAAEIGMDRSRLHRTLAQLKKRYFIIERQKSRNPGGGYILYVCGEDDIAALRQEKIRRLSQLIRRVTTQKDWEKDQSKKQACDSMRQHLSQLQSIESTSKQRELGKIQLELETACEPVDVLKHKKNSFSEPSENFETREFSAEEIEKIRKSMRDGTWIKKEFLKE